MQTIETPTIQGIKLKPLNTFRFSRIKRYLEARNCESDESVQILLAYAALAMASDERKLHIYDTDYEEAVVDAGLSLTDDELVVIGNYISELMTKQNEASVEIVTPEKK